jgi:hypothetical protein
MDLPIINLLAVLVAAIAAFAVGFLWHGPLFGKQWIALLEIPQSEMDAMRAKGMGPMVPTMIAGFGQQIVVALVMTFLAGALRITGLVPALLLAVFLWLGFIVTTLLNGVLWEKRKMNLYLFTIAYHLVSLIVISLIVVLWR